METLVVAHHHRNHNQFCGRSRSRSHDRTRFDSCGSAQSSNFTGITCRSSFQSGAGLLPTPMKSISTKNVFAASLSPKTPSSAFNESKKYFERNAKSSTVLIPVKINFENEGNFNFSERWAGPAYSNSPPPSSVPFPHFTLPPKPKRTVSLHLPTSASEFDLRPMAKSAPPSPTRGRSPSPHDLLDPPSPRNLFEPPSASDIFEHRGSSGIFDRADATKTLRRILNLNITNE